MFVKLTTERMQAKTAIKNSDYSEREKKKKRTRTNPSMCIIFSRFPDKIRFTGSLGIVKAPETR